MALVESFSGIRGEYGTELTDEIIKKYAVSFLELLKKKNPDKKEFKIVIGRDSRPSSKTINKIILQELDCKVLDIGMSPTPIIENAVRAFDCDAGIIITGSHNEPNFNGIKFLDKDGAIIRPKDIDFVINKSRKIKLMDQKKGIVKNQNFPGENFGFPEYSQGALRGNFSVLDYKNVIDCKKQAVSEYIKFVNKHIKKNEIDRKIKLIVDPNGGSGIISKEIFDYYKINAVYLNMQEGKFNRLIEPKEESLKYLKQEIIKENADFALGFDCDADRVEILLPDGSLVSGNHILAIITDEILSETKEPAKEIVAVNDATSYDVKEICEKYNAKFKEVEVGEINVVDEMIKNNSVVGGEGSNGGVIIYDSRCRDGILTILFLLKLLKRKNKSLNELINELPKYYYIKEKIKIIDDFWNIRTPLEEYYLKNGFSLLKTGDKTGGLKCLKDGSWIWFRQSKTEDKVLRIITDSKDEKIAKELIDEAKGLLERI